MIRTLLVSLGTASALAASSLFAGGATAASASPASTTATGVTAAADKAPVTRAQASNAMDAALAAAIIGSLSSQFAASNVRVQLDDMKVVPTSIQDRQVTGAGRMQLNGDSEWIPFKFAALYDTASTEVTYPQLQLGGGAATPLAPRSTLAKAFTTQVLHALATEFSDQRVRWSLDHATSRGNGRFVRVEGDGNANFGNDGRTRAHVQGVLDTRTGNWARVHYELGADSRWVDPSPVATL